MNYFVNALAIRRWADQIAARSTLPHVLRRLVHATLKDVTLVDFPAPNPSKEPGLMARWFPLPAMRGYPQVDRYGSSV